MPFESYACYSDATAVEGLEYHNPKEERQAADALQDGANVCKNACNSDTNSDGVQICHAYSYLGFLTGNECRLLRDPSIESARRITTWDLCAATCTDETECKAFAHAPDASASDGTGECALYFTAGYGSTADLNTGSYETREIAAAEYCVRKPRDIAADRHLRITHNAAWDSIQVADAPEFAGAASNLYFMRACSKGALGCLGQTCTAADLMATLNGEIGAIKSTTMITGNEVESEPAFINFGCVTSGSDEHSVYEDCLPPEPKLLADIKYGFYFETDVSGRPANLALTQARGKMLFSWTDMSTCEQAFSFTRRHEALDNQGTSRTWTAAESLTQDYYVHGMRTCQEHVVPEDLYDELIDAEGVKRPVGLWQDYCVTAMSENGASSLSYESEAQCETAQMFWESTIAGQIVVHSVYHPKAGITVSWEVNGFPSLSGSVVTNGAGEFEIHIRDTFNVV